MEAGESRVLNDEISSAFGGEMDWMEDETGRSQQDADWRAVETSPEEGKSKRKACLDEGTEWCFQYIARRVSFWHQLKKTVAWILQFKSWLLFRTQVF